MNMQDQINQCDPDKVTSTPARQIADAIETMSFRNLSMLAEDLEARRLASGRGKATKTTSKPLTAAMLADWAMNQHESNIG